MRLGARDVFGDMALLTSVRGGGRARDVRDGRDVIPIDAMSDPEQQRGREERQGRRGRGRRRDGGDQVHRAAVAGKGSGIVEKTDIETPDELGSG